MAEIVNLRRVKKARERAAAAGEAQANRARHGRTRAEREAEALGKARQAAQLDGAKLDPASDGDGEPRE